MKSAQALMTRLLRRTVKTRGCWLWIGSKTKKGYGHIRIGSRADGSRRVVLVHRLSYELHIGPIPKGHGVLHTCDTPPCIKPTHLFTGTNTDNVADRQAKGRTAKGDRSGYRKHPERYKARPKHEHHWKAKLNESQVREIRYLAGTAKWTHREIASMFGVGRSAITKIVRGETWR